jgi:signal transduction histidine kinase
LIDNLVAISNAEPLLFQRQAVNSAELLQEAIDTVPLCCQRDITVALDIAADAPTISADRRSLVWAVSLLLSNACRCSLPDTQVAASLRRASDPQLQDYLQLSISDTGRGITSADRPRVFNYRCAADEAPVQGLGESGLGLSVAKLIIEVHDGRIWIDSKLGTGTTFTILLPAAPSKEIK